MMQSGDDRRNFAQPCLIDKVADHPILDGLPWDQPPGIGGFNAVTAKPGAETLLAAAQFSVSASARRPVPVHAAATELPLLVVGQHGRGRTAALATDVAPALGRRTGRLGRPARRAGSGRRIRSKSATGTPASSATCWSGRAIGCDRQQAIVGSQSWTSEYDKGTSIMLHGNAIIGQSGGPTSVINASLCGHHPGRAADKHAIGKHAGHAVRHRRLHARAT